MFQLERPNFIISLNVEYIINIDDPVLKLAHVLQLGCRFSFSNNQNKK